ncbi:MAG: translation initiation factor IF-2 [Candidatus Woesearchaeota archaeon]
MTTRSPICVVLGHVDHGKTSLLDKIRGTAIQKGEAAGITQAIGASIIPLETVKQICGQLLLQLKMDFTIPGLLFIDTPGHAAFTNLRKRGGNLADIAIVVIDLNEGFKPQTHETIQILKQFKTPFIIAANKLDLIPGWQHQEGSLLVKISNQYDPVKTAIDTKLYEIVGKLSEYSIKSERFDRIEDFTQEVAIVPVSAHTGEGVPEVLMVLTGLAQKFLNKCLTCKVEGPAKGTILEVKEETGLGTTADVIVYDGTLNVNDTIVIGGIDKPITTKVRALLLPQPLSEMRDKKTKYIRVTKVEAATGVKVLAPDLDKAVAGMPLQEATSTNLEQIQEKVRQEIAEIFIETGKTGIVVKADTVGSLEALTNMLKQASVPIRKASIGQITKKDISEALASKDSDPMQAVVLGFNVLPNKEAQELALDSQIEIITSNIVYRLLDDYKAWYGAKLQNAEAHELEKVTRPCKIQIMQGYVFRQRNPAVVGVDVLCGTLASGIELMKATAPITTVKSIQHENENIKKAEQGKQVSASLDRVTIGRQLNEGDTLYSYIPEEDFRKLKELKKYLKPEEKQLLKEIAELMRKTNPVWGI